MSLSMIPVYSPSTWGMKGSSFDVSRAPLSVGENVKKNHEIRRRLFGINLEKNSTVIDGRATFSHSRGQSDMVGPSKGIGIENYFERKNIFLTGATGLLGKGLLEKILRSTEVGKIYVLVNAEDHEAAMLRLEKEVISSDLCECLRKKHGKYYKEFMREKVIPIVGDISRPNLGMDSHSATTIMEQVNVVVASAAITHNERYDLILDTNVTAIERLLSFARTCKNLDLFVQISTAYVNATSEGIILEKPMIMGENRRKDNGEPTIPRLDIAQEVNLALRSSTTTTNHDLTREMKRLGMERAAVYGWPATYHFTKAMAEMVLDETRGDIPVVVIRPSVIESCYKEPQPGWIQGNRMFDPFIISYGKGQLPAFLGLPHAPIDIVPLDMFVNATIAAIANHGQMHKPELNVYHVASSVANPLLFSEFFEYIYDYFSSDPLIESKDFVKIKYHDNIAKMEYFDDFNEFSKYTREEISRRMESKAAFVGLTSYQKQEKLLNAQVTYAENLNRIYEVVAFSKARFDASNTAKLLSEMSDEERTNFAFDVSMIDWRKYFQEIHIPGLRKHVLNEEQKYLFRKIERMGSIH